MGNTIAGDKVELTLSGAETNAGEDYTATATLTGDDASNYKLPENSTVKFSIAQASINPTVTIEGWTYGAKVNTPSLGEGSNPGNGEVTFEYSEKDKDTWSTDAPTTAGKYTVRATVAETANYLSGTATKDFTIKPASIEAASVKVAEATYTYTGSALTPDVVVTLGDNTLSAETDYIVAYADNVDAGTATVTVTGKGNCTGTATATFAIAPKSIKDAKVVLGPSLTANDQEQEQTIESVTLADGTELDVSDFKVSGNKVTAAGDYTLTVTGAGNYADSVDVAFTVAPNPDQVAADAAAEKIEAIGKVEYTEESEAAIKDAREAYDELSNVQKQRVDDDVLKTLENAETAYQKLDDEVKTAEEAIEAIGDVSYDERSKDAIDAARAAYDALDQNQKKRFDEQMLTTLENAEATYQQAAQDAADKEAAEKEAEEKAKREEEEKVKREAEEREAAEKEAAKKAEQDKAKKNDSKKEKLVGTGDNSAAAVAAAAIAGISLATAGIATRRRNN